MRTVPAERACTSGGVGEACSYGIDCKSMRCVGEKCTAAKLVDDVCDRDFDCASRACATGRCVDGSVGSKCEARSHCRGHDAICFRGSCRAFGKSDDACDSDDDCRDGLRCVEYTCLTPAGLRALGAKRDARNEARMLAESGVPIDPKQVEKAVPPPGPGQRVRTVKITAKRFAVAACKFEERLVGGGCNASEVKSSYPSGQSDEDTVGARWNCTVDAYVSVTAYALCMRLP